MLTRINKESLATEYNEIFSNISSGVLLDYKRLTVLEMTEFRKKLQAGSDSRLKVLKNRVAKIVAQKTPLKDLSEHFSKTRALAYSKNDLVQLSKLVCKQLDELDNCQLICGFSLENGQLQLLDKDQVVAMSKLESKEELLGKFLYLLNAPITNFAKTLNEVPAKFVRLLKAIADNK